MYEIDLDELITKHVTDMFVTSLTPTGDVPIWPDDVIWFDIVIMLLMRYCRHYKKKKFFW